MSGMTMIQIEARTVPAALRATRALAGLSTREMGALIGVSHAAIARWERGEGEPTVTQFMLWARATKQPAETLLGGLDVDLCARRDSNPQPSDLYLAPLALGVALLAMIRKQVTR